MKPGAIVFAAANARAHVLPTLQAGAGEAAAEQQRRKRDIEIARAEGYARGVRDGQENARVELTAVCQALRAAANKLVEERRKHLAEARPQLVRLCIEAARKLAMSEIRANPECLASLLAAIIAEAEKKQIITLRLNQDDHRVLAEGPGAALLEGLTARLVNDPAISRGGCLVETDHGLLDARIETRVETLYEQMLATEPA